MCDAGSWFSPEYAGEQIPTLEEIFLKYGTSVNYYIETKNPDAAPGMEEELLQLMDEYDLLEPAAEDWRGLHPSLPPGGLLTIHHIAIPENEAALPRVHMSR